MVILVGANYPQIPNHLFSSLIQYITNRQTWLRRCHWNRNTKQKIESIPNYVFLVNRTGIRLCHTVHVGTSLLSCHHYLRYFKILVHCPWRNCLINKFTVLQATLKSTVEGDSGCSAPLVRIKRDFVELSPLKRAYVRLGEFLTWQCKLSLYYGFIWSFHE